MLLYKYRSTSDFRRFVDIILHNRLYASPYFELNDPLEGHYLYNREETSQTIINEMRNGKSKVRICSLSDTQNDHLMWSHYADGYRGVVIGVIVTVADDEELVRIEYMDKLPFYSHDVAPKQILSCKLNAWFYEREYRVFTSREYVQVEIKQIFLGHKMNENNKTLVRNLTKRLSQDIQVIELPKASYQYFHGG